MESGEWRGERSGVGNDEAVPSADSLKADITWSIVSKNRNFYTNAAANSRHTYKERPS